MNRVERQKEEPNGSLCRYRYMLGKKQEIPKQETSVSLERASKQLNMWVEGEETEQVRRILLCAVDNELNKSMHPPMIVHQ
jgi:hypothetical protein